MRLTLSIRLLLSALVIATSSGNRSEATDWQPSPSAITIKETDMAVSKMEMSEKTSATVSYRIQAGQSRFMVHVGSTGLLWFMGHTHHFAVRDFTGEATLNSDNLVPASLQMTIQAASLEETGKNFTEQQKQIINKEARIEVLETDRYPEITFKSTAVTGKMKSEGHYEVKLVGDLTLHGVTRPIEIPAQVMVKGDRLQATGEFSVSRSDYQVRTKAIKGGMIRVSNKVTFEFDITAHKI